MTGVTSREYAEFVVLTFVEIWMVSYMLRSIAKAWKQRPTVRWEPEMNRWVAKRATHGPRHHA